MMPVMAVTLVFGFVDGMAAAGFGDAVPAFFGELPLAGQGMGWLLPALITLMLAAAADRLLAAPARA